MYKYFIGHEKLLDKLVDVATCTLAAIILLVVIGTRITQDTAFIPTIINGITATTSIIVAGTGLVSAFANAHKLIQRNRAWGDRIYCTFALILVSIGLVFMTYVEFIWGDYTSAVRIAMTGMTIALMTFANFTFFVLRRYIEPILPR